MLITIEEFASKKQPAHDEHSKDLTVQGYVYFMSLAIDFAKLHVEDALKAASDKAKASIHQSDPMFNEVEIYAVVSKQSILTAYPLENIK